MCRQQNITDTTRTDGELVLLLHGGSKTLGKDRFQYLQTALAKANIASLAFDFSGMGGSGGVFEESSLAKRTEETLCVIKYLKEKYPKKRLTLYGVSMGGYVALAVVNRVPDIFASLILHAPTAYAEEAHSLNFNEEFTAVLRQDKSWISSLSFKWLAHFNGRVLFLTGNNDPVIPSEVVTRYQEILRRKPRTTFFSITDMAHNIWTDKKQSEKHRNMVSDYLSSFINNWTKN